MSIQKTIEPWGIINESSIDYVKINVKGTMHTRIYFPVSVAAFKSFDAKLNLVWRLVNRWSANALLLYPLTPISVAV